MTRDDAKNTDDGEHGAASLSFTDAELDAAMADFMNDAARDAEATAALADNNDAGDADGAGSVGVDGAHGVSSAIGDGIEGSAPSLDDFSEELESITGERAQKAALITRIKSAELLAAFCQVAGIDAQCLQSEQGAVAVLRALHADEPERAAADLTQVVAGLSVVLAVKRADMLEATLYISGAAGEHFAPPLLFSSTASFVEDYLLDIASLDDIIAFGVQNFDAAQMSREEALRIIAKARRFGGGARRR